MFIRYRSFEMKECWVWAKDDAHRFERGMLIVVASRDLYAGLDMDR